MISTIHIIKLVHGLIKQGRKQMKYLFIIVVFFFVGCTSYDYRIDKMPSRTLSYKQLPERVKNKLADFSRHIIDEKNRMLLCEDNDSNKYQTEAIPFIVGFDYIKLIDISNNIVYRIEQGTPLPYILYKDKLYLADDYNIYDVYEFVHYSEYNLYQE
jgi:hypothetical protein